MLIRPNGEVVSGAPYWYSPTRVTSPTTGTRIVVAPLVLGLPVHREDLSVKTPEQKATATPSWFEQEMISGLPNKYLAGTAALAGILFVSRKN